MWPVVHTRPDLAYSVRVLSRFAHNFSEMHCNLVKRIFKYVKRTLNTDFNFRRDSPDDLTGYSDSDFAGLKDKRHSTDDYVFMLTSGAISHSFKQQSVIALSSCEAEYMALTETAKKAIWANRFLHDLGYKKESEPVQIYADNRESIDLTINPMFHKRTKHIEIRWH